MKQTKKVLFSVFSSLFILMLLHIVLPYAQNSTSVDRGTIGIFSDLPERD